ncbi:hypothetical protein DRP53_03355 [candidate division WOR-3 bacterium]|uniref:Uncharacterized protein n=1 Tax=candidate division WOR-3 bacterium TaxID=2052148 RepID=A0A660SJC0_UNCW3|nr:MAG: hypothetical protein DRP53_03355 [candidate division WOR-3 bacterium]
MVALKFIPILIFGIWDVKYHDANNIRCGRLQFKFREWRIRSRPGEAGDDRWPLRRCALMKTPGPVSMTTYTIPHCYIGIYPDCEIGFASDDVYRLILRKWFPQGQDSFYIDALPYCYDYDWQEPGWDSVGVIGSICLRPRIVMVRPLVWPSPLRSILPGTGSDIYS